MVRQLAGFAALALAWEIGGRAMASPFLPPLSEVLAAAGRLAASGELLQACWGSLTHVLLGVGIASALGVSLGIAIAEAPLLAAALSPVVDAVRGVPALTMFPLLILVLGLGVKSKAFVIFWTAWPAVTLNTVHGIRNVDRDTVGAAMLDGAGWLALMAAVKLPLAWPTILTGLRLGLSGGWISVVSAEMLGGSQGLGYAVLSGSQTFRFPEMYAAILTIAALGLLMNKALLVLEEGK